MPAFFLVVWEGEVASTVVVIPVFLEAHNTHTHTHTHTHTASERSQAPSDKRSVWLRNRAHRGLIAEAVTGLWKLVIGHWSLVIGHWSRGCAYTV